MYSCHDFNDFNRHQVKANAHIYLQTAFQHDQALIYNGCLHSKQGQKDAYSTSYTAIVGIFKNKLLHLGQVAMHMWGYESKSDYRSTLS